MSFGPIIPESTVSPDVDDPASTAHGAYNLFSDTT